MPPVPTSFSDGALEPKADPASRVTELLATLYST